MPSASAAALKLKASAFKGTALAGVVNRFPTQPGFQHLNLRDLIFRKRGSHHERARATQPVPSSPVRINTYHRDITTMRLSGMRSGAILGFFRLGAVVFITREPKEVVCRKTKADEYTPKKPGALVPHVEKLSHEIKY